MGLGLALALIVLGVLILLDRMGIAYGVREGWPWLVVAFGVGGLFRNRKSLAAWVITIIGIFILVARYYSFPAIIRTYLLPAFLIAIGFLLLSRYANFGVRLTLSNKREQPFLKETESKASENKDDNLQSPAKQSSQQTVGPAVIVEYAGFWKRFAAFVVDYILVFIATFIVCFVSGLSINISGGNVGQDKAVGYILGFFIW